MTHVCIPTELTQIWVPSNPRGAERLVPGIVVPHSDLYLRRMYGKPSEVIICITMLFTNVNYGHKLIFIIILYLTSTSWLV